MKSFILPVLSAGLFEKELIMFGSDEQQELYRTRTELLRKQKRRLTRLRRRPLYSFTPKHGATPPPSLPAPRYESVGEAPDEAKERAIRERFPWIRRYVMEGFPYGRLLSYACMYGRSAGIPQQEWPSSSAISRWSRQWQYWGMRGLL